MSTRAGAAVGVACRWGLGLALGLALSGCGSSAPETWEPAPTTPTTQEPTWGGDEIVQEGAAAPQSQGYEPSPAPAPAAEVASLSSDSGGMEEVDAAMQSGRPRYAQASVRASPPALSEGPPVPAGAAAPPPPAVMTDGHAGPLLIYEAQLAMASYKVEETQRQVIAAVKELGGFLTQQQSSQLLVVRVPAQQFYAAIEKLEAIGQVSDLHMRAQDVTDAFRDLEMRLRNAEAVRDRLVKLLDKAPDVPQSLQVEHELDRITERIELLKGQLKSMGDRIAFSTITIRFQPKRDEVINPEFQLPFEWLRFLGLQHLLSLPSP